MRQLFLVIDTGTKTFVLPKFVDTLRVEVSVYLPGLAILCRGAGNEGEDHIGNWKARRSYRPSRDRQLVTGLTTALNQQKLLAAIWSLTIDRRTCPRGKIAY